MQIKINGQTISLAAPEPFLSILRIVPIKDFRLSNKSIFIIVDT